MQGERDRIYGARNQLGACACRLERCGERVSGGSLAVDADRETGRLAQAGHQLARAMWLQRARGIVEEHACSTEVRQLPRLLHQRVGLAGSARAVDEAGLEL